MIRKREPSDFLDDKVKLLIEDVIDEKLFSFHSYMKTLFVSARIQRTTVRVLGLIVSEKRYDELADMLRDSPEKGTECNYVHVVADGLNEGAVIFYWDGLMFLFIIASGMFYRVVCPCLGGTDRDVELAEDATKSIPRASTGTSTKTKTKTKIERIIISNNCKKRKSNKKNNNRKKTNG